MSSFEIQDLVKKAEAAGLARAEKIVNSELSSVNQNVEGVSSLTSADASVIAVAATIDAINNQPALTSRRRKENPAESDGAGERLSMEYLNNFKEERLRILNACESIEEFELYKKDSEYRFKNFMISQADLDDIKKSHPLTPKEIGPVRRLRSDIQSEIYTAFENKEKELREKASVSDPLPLSSSDKIPVVGALDSTKTPYSNTREREEALKVVDPKKGQSMTPAFRKGPDSSANQKTGQEESNPEELQENLVAMDQEQNEARAEDAPASPSQDNAITLQKNIIEVAKLERQRAEHEARLQALQEEEGSLDIAPMNGGEKPEVVEVVSETPEQEAEQIPGVDREAEQANIDNLRTMVGEMRTYWVKKDVENRDAWKKFKSMFGIEKSAEKNEVQVAYENALNDLRDAEISMLRRKTEDGTLSVEEREKEIERLIRYYKLDESTNLIDARTQYKSEHLKDASGIEKVTVLLGNLGRFYNRIPLKGKLAITAAFLGTAAGIALSGGSGTAVGALAFASVMRKVVSGAGVAVGTEALLESFGAHKRISKAKEEIEYQVNSLTFNVEGSLSEHLSELDTLLKKDIDSLNTKLQNEKRAKTWRKVSAVGVGGLVGSGWLAQIAMDHLGGNQAVDWVKDQIGNTPQAPAQIPAPGEVSPPATPSVPVPSEAPIEAPQIPKPDALTGVLNQDYVVKPGDSVWKIAGGIADTMNLKGAQRTYFIDALKDQYGDVQLKTGETIKFSDHGIDKAFVDNAFSQAQSLSPDQIASITANDAKIADYVASHPGTTLTNAKVDEILSGKIASQSVGENTPPLEQATESSVSNVVPVESPSVSREPVFTAELTPRVNDWYMQMFRMENPGIGQDWIVDKKEMSSIKLMDIFKDAKLYKAGSFTGYKTGLNPEQIKNFTQFFQGVEDNNIAFDRMAFLREHPNVTVMDYLKKISTLVTPGQRLGLYTTTQ